MASLSSAETGRTAARGTARGRGSSAAPQKASRLDRPASAPAANRLGVIGDALARPMASYYLVLVSSALLACLGVVMVLSSSSVYSQASPSTGYNPYYFGQKQLVFLLLGLPLAWWVSRRSESVLRTLSWVAMLGSLVLLMAVFIPGVGDDSDKGNMSWINVGGLSLQPSELSKLGLVMWAAAVVATKEKVIDRPRELVPLLGGFALVLGLVLAQKDLGTAVIIGGILFGLLWVIGVPGRLIGMLALAGTALVTVLVATSENRMNRILMYLGMAEANPNASRQPMAAIYALASGGWWGLGLGGSRQKWGNLYDGAMNDFVFAVIGEELGLAGTLMVLFLLAVLGYAAIRIALRADSTYARVLCGGIACWLMFQAMTNIGVAMGLLPVLGVPLPFLSQGGSALLANLLAVGLLLSCARHEPAARRARARRRGEPAPRVTTIVDGRA